MGRVGARLDDINYEFVQTGMITQECPDITLRMPIGSHEAKKIPARTLAYIGDSVFELNMRLQHVLNDTRTGGNLQGSMVSIVCADNQACLFDRIFPEVPEQEQALLKTWRNAKMPRKPIASHRTVYAKSTAFEAWIGYLFLTGETDRLRGFFVRMRQDRLTPREGEADET